MKTIIVDENLKDIPMRSKKPISCCPELKIYRCNGDIPHNHLGCDKIKYITEKWLTYFCLSDYRDCPLLEKKEG